MFAHRDESFSRSRTTIIEALKYAITGSFPPGCGRSGNAFVHDAKCIGQTNVKANVKLRFTSRTGQSMVVIRSMELTQKKTTQTFKQLDGVLRMMDPETGERVSLSHKCTELDKQLPSLLGVSKPILEHVVFCHQEDASWPLMEGAVLKKRFDDIFDSTKYSKALVVFRQTEKDFLSKVKDLKAEVAAFGAHKQAAEGFRKELDEQNEQVNALDDLKNEVNSELTVVEQKLDSLDEVMTRVEDMNQKIESCKNDLNQEQMVIRKQRSMLEEDLTRKHALPYLQDMLRNFDQKMSGQIKHKEELRAQCDQLQQSIEMARQEEMSLTSRVGKLSAEKEAHEKNLRERYRSMEHIAQTFAIDLMQATQTQSNSSLIASLSQSVDHGHVDDDDAATLVTITEEDMKGFMEAVRAKEAELQAKLKERRDRSLADDDSIAASLTELGGKLQAVENGEHASSEYQLVQSLQLLMRRFVPFR
jgi:DNA repair protein RAD50